MMMYWFTGIALYQCKRERTKIDVGGKERAEDDESSEKAGSRPACRRTQEEGARSTHTLTHAAGRKLTALHKHKVLAYYGAALQVDERGPAGRGVTAECGPGH